MSALITEARVLQFRDNIQLLYQQQGSKLRGTGRIESVTGKSAFFERLGATAAVQKTTRHGDTPQVDSQHSRRKVDIADFEWADLIDQQDKIKMLIDPTSEYALNAAWALGRTLDTTIYDALRGNAFAGETGATTVILPAGQKIAHGGLGLTKEKIIETSKKLNLAEVPREDRVFVVESNGLEDLLNDAEITSTDYNSVRLLMSGELETFMGFKWILYNSPKIATEWFALAYHRRALGIGEGMELMARIDERPDKSYATQVYAAASFGATRIEDEGVVEIAYQ